MAKITKIESRVPIRLTRKRVAAYARVSKETERLNHSLSEQISYYSKLIQQNPAWEYAGVYADEEQSYLALFNAYKNEETARVSPC